MAERNVRQVCVTDEIWDRLVDRIEELDPIGPIPAVQQNTLVSAALLHFSSLTRAEALGCLFSLQAHEDPTAPEPETVTTT